MKFFDDDLFPRTDFRPSTDCFIAAAAIGAVGSLAGAGISAYGANKAADAQTAAENNAISAQQQMFNTAQANLSPFINAGTSGISSLQSYLNNPNSTLAQAAGLNNTSNPNSALSQLLALVTPGASQTSTLAQTPGFQFLSQYGTMATENAQAAMGAGGPGGNMATAISNYNQGLAGTQYSTIVNALQNALSTGTSNLTNTYSTGANALQNLVNTGANAAAGLSSAATTAGQGIASSDVGIGNAQAGAATSTANSAANAISGISSNLSNQNLLSVLAGQGGLTGSVYTPAQIQSFGNLQAGAATDAQANAYGAAYGLTP